MGTPNDLVQADLYDGIGNANNYTMMPGICILPLAEDPPTDPTELANYSPVVIGKLHAPYRMRQFNFSEQKQNNPPVIATPKDVGAFVFIGGSINFMNQFNSTWWNSDWNVSGTYSYIENCVSRPQDGFVLGSTTPFSNDANIAAINMYPPNPSIKIGAIAQAGPSAQAGYLYGQYLVQGVVGSQTQGSQESGSSNGSLQVALGIRPAWNYTMSSFYPGTLLNDGLANGSI